MNREENPVRFPVFMQPKDWTERRKLQKTSKEQTGKVAHVLDRWSALSRLKKVQLDRGAGLKPRQRVMVEALKATDWTGLRKLATDQAGRIGKNANPH